jgi:hypothetical protein
MTQITFKQQFTFEEEAVKGFALFLGWKEKLFNQIEVTDQEATDTQAKLTHFEQEEVDNTETYIDYVSRRAKENSLAFTKQWAEKLKQDYISTQLSDLQTKIEPTLQAQIIKPVEDALITEVSVL